MYIFISWWIHIYINIAWEGCIYVYTLVCGMYVYIRLYIEGVRIFGGIYTFVHIRTFAEIGDDTHGYIFCFLGCVVVLGGWSCFFFW